MPQRIRKDGPLATMLAEVCMLPRERIQNFVVLVQHDKGVVVLHTLCCMDHVREGLATIATTEPDMPDLGDYRSEN